MRHIEVFYLPYDEREPAVRLQVEDELSKYQELVGGYIEILSTHLTTLSGDRVVLVVNEEGCLRNLPYNPRASTFAPAWGNAFLVVLHSDPEEGDVFLSLPNPGRSG